MIHLTFDITWTITAIIAVSSFLSPIFVARINNRHSAKMRELDLAHDETMRKLDLQHQATIKQFDIYYADKKAAFSEFMRAAGHYSMGKQSASSYESMHAAVDNALLFCNSENQALLCDFLRYIDTSAFGGGCSPKERTTYSERLNAVAISLNKELESTKPVTDRKHRE